MQEEKTAIDYVQGEFKKLFKTIHYEVIMLHYHWQIYRELYGSGPDNIKLLNNTASRFFAFVQDLFYNHIQLTLSKLLDNAYFGKRENNIPNMSLKKLTEEIRESGCEKLADRIDIEIKILKEKCNCIRKRRDKRISHFDYEIMVEKKSELLPGVSRKDIEDALDHLAALMNKIIQEFANVSFMYKKISSTSGGMKLIGRLTELSYYDELKKMGKITNKDISELRMKNYL